MTAGRAPAATAGATLSDDEAFAETERTAVLWGSWKATAVAKKSAARSFIETPISTSHSTCFNTLEIFLARNSMIG